MPVFYRCVIDSHIPSLVVNKQVRYDGIMKGRKKKIVRKIRSAPCLTALNMRQLLLCAHPDPSVVRPSVPPQLELESRAGTIVNCR